MLKILKTLKVLLLVMAGLVVIIFLLFLFPPVQNYIAGKAVSRLQQKLHTDIKLGRVQIVLPNAVTLHNLYIEDLDRDTLLNAGMIKINVGLFGLLKKNLIIRQIILKNVTGKISRTENDSSFNFSFIPRAFSSGASTPATDTTRGSPMNVGIGQVKLSGIHFTYNDQLTGNKVKAGIGDFSVWFKKFSLNPMVFNVRRFVLVRSYADISLSGSSASSSGSESPAIYLQRKSRIGDVGFYYHDKVSGQTIDVRHADLDVDPDKVDVKNGVVKLKRIELQHALVAVKAGTTAAAAKKTSSGNNGPFTWDIAAGRLVLNDNTFNFDVDTVARTPGVVNFGHLGLMNMSGNINDILVNKEGYKATIERFSLREQSGFILSRLSGHAEVSDNHILLDNLTVNTPGTHIQNSSSLLFPSFQEMIKGPGKTTFDIRFTDSRISPHDILYFSPPVKQYLPSVGKSKGSMKLDTKVSGYIRKSGTYFSDIDISHLRFRVGNSLSVSLKGNIKGLPEIKSAHYDLSLDTLLIHRQDLFALLPDSTVPASLHLPERIGMAGNFKGSMDHFATNIRLESTQGDVTADLNYNGGSGAGRETYSGRLNVAGYDLGALLAKSDSLGKISLNGRFHGSSKKFKDPDATFDINVSRFGALGYSYQDIKLSGTFANHVFNGSASVRDTNIVAQFNGKASLKDTVPEYDFTLAVEGLDARALHLTPKDIRLKGTVTADFTGGTIDSINGSVKAYNAVIVNNGNFFPLDSIVLKASNSPEKTSLNLKSQFMVASYDGTVRISKLPGLMKDYLDYYFDIQQDTSKIVTHKGNFELQAKILNTEPLSQIFMPDLNNFIQAEIKASYEGDKPSFEMTANFPEVNYKGYVVDTFNVNVTSNKNQVEWTAGVEHAYAKPFEVPPTSITGTISRDTIHWELTSKGNQKKDLYHIGGFMQSRNKSLYLGIDSSNLVLNKKSFTIPPANYIKITDSGLQSHRFVLQSGKQKLELNPGSMNDSIRGIVISFTHFNINNITALISGGKDIFSAYTDGKVILSKNSTFSSDLAFTDVAFFNNPVFQTIDLQAGKQPGGKLTFSAGFRGENDNMKFTGQIPSGQTPGPVDIKADIGKLDLSSFESFFPSQLKSLKGDLSGNLAISNSLADPMVSGSLSFSDVSVTPVFTNSTLRLTNDKIGFEGRTVKLSDFTLRDTDGNTMTLDGSIDASQIDNPLFHLTLNTSKFQFLNTGSESRNMFYGHLVAGIKARINGSIYSPDVNLDANLGYDSQFYFVVPEAGGASIEQQGVVEFVQKRTDTAATILTREVHVDTTVSTNIRNLNLTSNISLSNSMKMTIIVDPTNNEALEIQGSGNLSYDLKGSGQMTLAGSYKVDEGSYSLTLYEVLKRKFNIEKGSTLTWTGDVSNPRIDLSTWYPVKTSPQPIIAPQMTGASQSQNMQYNSNMDFKVYMYIQGNLMQPSISFAIKQPPSEQDANIQARLTQLNSNESELNKQVFSLLLFNSFLQENSLSQNSFAYDLNATARKGVGNLLAQQINRFSQEYIPGFNFNVNINSYSGNAPGQAGGHTNVQMNVKKNLLNNRLSIQVGGNVNIQDNNPNTTAPANVNNLAGDVVVEYKLTPDGVYRIQVFKKNEYEDVLDGQLNKTGLAFIFNRDFYTFSKLFNRKKDKAAGGGEGTKKSEK
ncbi:MAG TPA: translocation/assembly module TamB domain-containing protein [Bacteroidales bacterium]|nr:translocation/assembly module TamB domain-containing protein [Bacteroidales bacterium]